MTFITLAGKRAGYTLRRAAAAGALAAAILGAAAPQAAIAAPPTTNYYQISLGTAVGSTISTANDNLSGGAACTLRDAIDAANGGITMGVVNGCNIVQVGAGGPYVIRLPKSAYTYTLNGSEITILNTHDIFIVGSKPSASIIQAAPTPGTATRRIFSTLLGAGDDITIENVTLRNGRCEGACPYSGADGGAIYQNGGTLTLRNSVVTQNIGDTGGGAGSAGAVYLLNGTLNITGKSILSKNSGGQGAGAIYQGPNSLVIIDGSTLIDNHATTGGHIITETANARLFVIHGSKITRTPGSPNSANGGAGGISVYAGKAVIDGSTISNQVAGGNGGAIYVYGGGSLTAQNKTVITGNSANSGGAIFLDETGGGATVTLDASTVKANSAINGGGVFVSGGLSTFIMKHGAQLTGNTVLTHGGGIFNDGGTVQITEKSQVAKNTAPASGGLGGGIFSDGATSITGGSLVTANTANLVDGQGGGFYGTGISLDGATISKNKASQGAGIYGQFGARNTIITGNIATDFGGGFYAMAAPSTILNSTVVGNIAQFGYGGGGYGDQKVIATNSTFSGNKATNGNGGGFNQQPGYTSIFNNVTFSGNVADYGGGLWVSSAGGADLFNVTITKNTAISAAGGLFADLTSTQTVYTNSIISGNSSPSGPDCSPDAKSDGYNLVGVSCDAGGTGDISAGMANLGALASNGGPTKTHALNAGSQAIDAGHPTVCQGDQGAGLVDLESDQRGYLREWNLRCDMGAFEAQPVPATLTSPKAGAATPTLTFKWKKNPGAIGQQLNIDTTPNCGLSVLGHSFGASLTSYTVPPAPTLPAYGNYYWCIRTFMPGAVPTANSEARAFEYTFLKSPLNNAYLKASKTGAYKFSWTPAFDPTDPTILATSYDFKIALDPAISVAVTTVPTTGLGVTLNLGPGTYYWRVEPNVGGLPPVRKLTINN